MSRTPKTPLRLFFALVSLSLAGACQVGPDDGGDDPGSGFEEPDPQISPSIIHTGYDGTNVFRVPVNTDLDRLEEGELSWQTGDEAVLSVTPLDTAPPGVFGVTWAMLETLQPGTTTVEATVGDVSLSAEVVVAEYTLEQVAAGDARYNDLTGTGARIACSTCHSAEQAASPVPHTPTELGFYDDAAILQAVVMGQYPDLCLTDARQPCECGSAGCTLQEGLVLNLEDGGIHAWELTPEESDGIVAYLRSLQPAGF